MARRLVGPRTRGAGQEHPSHAGHGFATDEAAFVEQPGVLAVELLEGVVGQDGGASPFGDLEDEGITPAGGAGGWGDDLVGLDGLFVGFALGWVDAVTEAGVDNHSHPIGGVLGHEGLHRFIELLQTW